MKILVTGGAGFIGSHLVDNLIARGFEVIVLDNLLRGSKLNENSNLKIYNKDITDLTSKLKKIYSLDDKSYDKLVRNSYIIKNKFSFNTINLNLSRFIKETN